MRIDRREFRIASLIALTALGVCQVGQGADDRGSLLERIRTSRTMSNANNSTGTSLFSSRRTQVTPLGTAQTGTTVIQPQSVMSFGPADIATGVENSLKKQLDPNAGHTLGKRKKKPGMSTSSSSAGLSVGSKYEPGAASSRASTDVVTPPTLGKRKKKPNNGGNTTTPSTGGGAQTNPAPQNPAPQNPTQPAPTGNVGFPWQDVVGTVVPYVVNRTPIYESPVYVTSPAPAMQEVIVNEPVTVEAPVKAEIEPATRTAGSDLVLEDMKLAAPATILAGPAYEVTFRNQSQHAVGAFRVMIVVGLDNKPAKDAPKAVLEIASLEAGEVGKATLRLPLVAMKMVAAGSDKPTAFSHLAVSVDSENMVLELDETNNRAIIERDALEPTAK